MLQRRLFASGAGVGQMLPRDIFVFGRPQKDGPICMNRRTVLGAKLLTLEPLFHVGHQSPTHHCYPSHNAQSNERLQLSRHFVLPEKSSCIESSLKTPSNIFQVYADWIKPALVAKRTAPECSLSCYYSRKLCLIEQNPKDF